MAAPLAVGALLLAGLGAGWASTAGNTMPSTNRASVTTIAVTPQALTPAACTGAIANLVALVAGGGSQTVATADTLVLGTSGNDNVQVTTGYACFVGGGPVAANTDRFTGPRTAGDQCILAASVKTAFVKNCTIVQSSP